MRVTVFDGVGKTVAIGTCCIVAIFESSILLKNIQTKKIQLEIMWSCSGQLTNSVWYYFGLAAPK
jgi:hypothetical protein